MRCLNAHKCRNQIAAFATGTTRTRISRGNLKKVEIFQPTLSDQRHIAEVLDRAEALRTKRRAALVQLDCLSQAIFMDMFGDPVTNPKGWLDSQSLGDVADIVSGVTIGRNLDGKSTRIVPYLAVINVQDRELNLSVVKTVAATDDEISRYRLKRNDLLLTEGGDPDKLGRGTLWSDELQECIHQNHVFRVRLRTADISPLYLNWLIGSQRGKRYFLKSAKQTTGIASINMTQLRGFPLIVPPRPLQDNFAARIVALEKLEAAHRLSLSQLDQLFASLQQRAFSGNI
jgi:type I restriction enzyme S subunit